MRDGIVETQKPWLPLKQMALVAATTPARLAVEQPGLSVTYGRLAMAVESAAQWLGDKDARSGDRAAIFTTSPAVATAGMLASIAVGCAFVPARADAPEERLRAIFADAGPRFLITDPASSGVAARLLPRSGIRQIEIRLEDDACPPADFAPYRQAPPLLTADQTAYLFYTSGSTGKPKGIAGRPGAVEHFIRWEIDTLGLHGPLRVSQVTPIDFDAVLRDLFVPISTGGTICSPGIETAADPEKLVAWLGTASIQVLHCVPSLFRRIAPHVEPAALPELRWVLMAGEPVRPEEVGVWFDNMGERVRLLNMYGPSETTMTKFAYEIRSADRRRHTIPIGRPIPGAHALLLDERGRRCPQGMAGEIYIRTSHRSLGYYNRPALTAAAFVPDLFSPEPGGILYRTGDMARVLGSGDFEFLGRRDHQVKIQGVRVELGEVEAVLASHSKVADTAVVFRGGDDGLAIDAFAETTEDVMVSDLMAYLRDRLGGPALPRSITLLAKLPRTANGKIDRRALSTLQARPNLAIEARDHFELRLVLVWKEILKKPNVGVRDSFFALGGGSMDAVRMLWAANQRLGTKLTLAAFLQNPTIEGLSIRLREAARGERDILVPFKPQATGKKLFLVHPVGGTVACYAHLASLLDDRLGLYGIQSSVLAGWPAAQTIEDMAALYIQSITAVEPRGPYHIAGWSMGGLVAYEIARQLSEQGRSVGALVLLDTSAERPRGVPPDDAEVLADAIPELRDILTPGFLRDLRPEERIRVAFDRARELGRVPPDYQPEDVARHLAAFRFDDTAMRAYTPLEYGGSISLIRCEVGVTGLRPDLGWSEYARGGVRVNACPAAHTEILLPPHVARVGELLVEVLQP